MTTFTDKLQKTYNQYKQKYGNITTTYEEKVAILDSMLNELNVPETTSYRELRKELSFRLDDEVYEDHAFDMLSEYPDFDVHAFYEDEVPFDDILELKIEAYRYIVRLSKMLEASLPQKQTTTKNDCYCLTDEETEALLLSY